MTKIVVTGGRDFENRPHLWSTLDLIDRHRSIDCLVSGGARGADQLAQGWAKARGVPVRIYPADWSGLGKKAGVLRNQQMLDEEKPDLCVAFMGGKGTADMVRRCRAAGIPVYPA